MHRTAIRLTVAVMAALFLAGCASAVPEPSPTPVSTPPAGVTETAVTLNEGTEWELDARLTLPASIKAAVPAVVLVPGSGPTDLNETVGGCAPFRDLAYGLSARGIAVLRFDKRTLTYGARIQQSVDTFTVEDEYVSDVLAAVAYLRTDARIDPERVAGIGHSLGGYVLPRIDAEGADFFAMVLLAGPARPLYEVSYDQNVALLSSYPENQRAALKKQVDAELDKARKLRDMSDEEARKVTAFTMPGYYLKDLAAKLPQDLLKKNAKPVLVLQGTADFQVSPDKDFGLFKTALAGRANTEFRLYDGLNHLFVASAGEKKGTAEEYSVPGSVSEKVVGDIANWLLGL